MGWVKSFKRIAAWTSCGTSSLQVRANLLFSIIGFWKLLPQPEVLRWLRAILWFFFFGSPEENALVLGRQLESHESMAFINMQLMNYKCQPVALYLEQAIAMWWLIVSCKGSKKSVLSNYTKLGSRLVVRYKRHTATATANQRYTMSKGEVSERKRF